MRRTTAGGTPGTISGRARRARWMRRIGRCGALIGVVALAGPVSAQESGRAPGLNAVDSLALEGELPGARRLLETWWEERWGEAGREERQRALWLRGKTALDAEEARGHYARLAVEFPGGPYSARALRRLALAATAEGKWAEAAAWFEELLTRHPGSPLRLEARAWLEEHGERVAEARRGAGEGSPGEGRTADDGGEVVEGADSRSDGRDVEASEAGPFSVQLGAFATGSRARRLAREVEAAGYRARLVRVEGSELIRVRVGRFTREEEARELRIRLEEEGFETMLVSDADGEVPFS